MNPKSAAALLAIVAGGEIALDHSDSLVPPDHVHAETYAESVATTASYLAASGTSGSQIAFDNEAFSQSFAVGALVPDDNRMTAVQRLMRLCDDI